MSDVTGFSTFGTPRPPLKPWGFGSVGTSQNTTPIACPDPAMTAHPGHFQGTGGLGLVLFPGQMQATLLAMAEAQLLNLLALQTLLRQNLHLPDELVLALRQFTRPPGEPPEDDPTRALLALLTDPTATQPLALEPLKKQWLHQLDELTSQLFAVMAHSGLSASDGQGHPQQDLMERMAHFHALLAEKPVNALTLLWGLYLPPIVLMPPYDFRFYSQPGGGGDPTDGGGSQTEELTLYMTTRQLGALTLVVGFSGRGVAGVAVQIHHDPALTEDLQQAVVRDCQQSHLPTALRDTLEWHWLPRSSAGSSIGSDSSPPSAPGDSRTSAQTLIAPTSGSVSPVLVLTAFAISAAIVAVDQSLALTGQRARRQEDTADADSTLQ